MGRVLLKKTTAANIAGDVDVAKAREKCIFRAVRSPLQDNRPGPYLAFPLNDYASYITPLCLFYKNSLILPYIVSFGG